GRKRFDFLQTRLPHRIPVSHARRLVRGNGVDANAFWPELHRDGAGEVLEACLRPGVARKRCRAPVRLDRREVDDAAATTALANQRYRPLNGLQHVTVVALYVVLPVLGRGLHEWAPRRAARQVDEDVES